MSFSPLQNCGIANNFPPLVWFPKLVTVSCRWCRYNPVVIDQFGGIAIITESCPADGGCYLFEKCKKRYFYIKFRRIICNIPCKYVFWISFDLEGVYQWRFFVVRCAYYISIAYKKFVSQAILDISDIVHEYVMNYIDALSSYQVKFTSNFIITSGMSHGFWWVKTIWFTITSNK